MSELAEKAKAAAGDAGVIWTRPVQLVRSAGDLKELGKALAVAQGELKNPHKSKTAKVRMKSGGDFTYQYADIADGLDVIRPCLSKHGLSLLQVPLIRGDTLMLITRILHASGQWIEGEYPVARIAMSHQDMGAAMTYARRQAAFAMVGIAGDEDTDGLPQSYAQPSPPNAQARRAYAQPSARVTPETMSRQQNVPPTPAQKTGGITPKDMEKLDPAGQGPLPEPFDSSAFYNSVTFDLERMANFSALTNLWKSKQAGLERLKQASPRMYAELVRAYEARQHQFSRRPM